MPGGRINSNEHWLEALKREIKEETGIVNFEISEILDADSYIDDNGSAHYIITFPPKT